MINIKTIYKCQGEDKDNLKFLDDVEDIDLKSLRESLTNPIDNTFLSTYDLKDVADNPIIAVAYSGGRDSLAHIIRLLKETNCYILPVINEFENVSRIMESNFLGEISLGFLSNAFPRRILYPFKNMNISLFNYGGCHSGIVLQPLNCLGIIACDNDLLKRISEYHVCYIMNDTALSYLNELENLYYAFVKARGVISYPKIKFPDIKVHKIDNICEIETFERDYLNYGCLPTLSCEEIGIKLKKDKEHFYIILEPCGHCDSCRKVDRHEKDGIDNIIYIFDRECLKRPLKADTIGTKRVPATKSKASKAPTLSKIKSSKSS